MTKPASIILDQIPVGHMENLAYFIGCAETRHVAVVDPAWDVDTLCSHVKNNEYTVTHILLTHGHYDHTDGVNELLEHYDASVYISAHETHLYKPGCANLITTDDHEKITIGSIELECLWTPGHTPGCQCYYYPGILITGDTLFINGCGRCDLPGGDPSEMYNSLYKKIMTLPDDTTIYPGHSYGPQSFDTLANQKKTNPYLRNTSREDFLKRRM